MDGSRGLDFPWYQHVAAPYRRHSLDLQAFYKFKYRSCSLVRARAILSPRTWDFDLFVGPSLTWLSANASQRLTAALSTLRTDL